MVQDVAKYINEYVRAAESAQALVLIQSAMAGLKGVWYYARAPSLARVHADKL